MRDFGLIEKQAQVDIFHLTFYILKDVDADDDPDFVLMAWLDHEEALFGRLEHKVVSERLSEGFAHDGDVDVDGFQSSH